MFAELRVPPSVRIVIVASLGKACGVPGGVVLSSDEQFVAELRRNAFFSASSPVVPAYLWAFVRAGHLHTHARQQLTANTVQFAQATAATGLFQSFEGFPVFYTPANDLADHLRAHDIWISSFPYPAPTDAPITRVVLSALHTPQDVAHVAALAREFAGR